MTKTTFVRAVMMTFAAFGMFSVQAEIVWYLDPDHAPQERKNRDGSKEKPFKDFDDAIDAAHATNRHVTVKVESSEPYFLAGRLEMPKFGITFMPMETNGVVTLEATNACRCVYDSYQKSTFYRFRFVNGQSSKWRGGGVFGSTLVDSVISNCWSGVNGGGIANASLTNCVITCCSSDGSGGGADNCDLFGCLIVSNYAGCAGGAASRSSLVNCTVTRNVAKGDDDYCEKHYFGSACDGREFVSDDGKTTNKCSILNCIVIGNSSLNKTVNPELYDFEFDSRNFGNLDGDPKFVDAARGDYRLRSDSPCIDIGNTGTMWEPAVDLARNPRVRGAGVDCGCYEFQRHAAFPPGTLNVSSNAQVIGTVLYAQGGWIVRVDDSAKDWLSADVTAGNTTNSLRLAFRENTTGVDRAGTVSVFTNGSLTAVQTVRIGQVARAEISGIQHRKGLFIGCSSFQNKNDGDPWQKKIDGCVNDARAYRDIWCGTNKVEDGVSVVLTNAQATLAAVTNNANAIIENLSAQDEFLLTISTHGTASEETGYWKVGFTLYPTNQFVSFSLLSNILIRASQKCRKVICILDTCHSAAAYKFADQIAIDGEISDRRSMPIIKLAAASPAAPYAGTTNIALIAAADYDQYSLSGKPNGRFTSCIIKGICEGLADADGDGYLDWHELWRYAYYMSKTGYENATHKDDYLGQARCYNAPLLLKTRVCRLPGAEKPSVDNPLNPYHVEYVNWLRKCEWERKQDFEVPENVVAASLARVNLTTGGSISYPDAFVTGYDPIDDMDVDPLVMFIGVTNATPYLSWEPCKRDAYRVYNIWATKSLTNDWTNLGENVPPATLKNYNFFSLQVDLRQ